MFQLGTEICLRSLALLVARGRGSCVQSSEIGDALGLSAAYVTKILQPLARQGWMKSQKGRGGGWSLVAEPRSVTLAQLIAILEPDRAWARCVIGHRTCSDETPCPFHDAWKKTLADFSRRMDRLTLADLKRYLPPGAPEDPAAG
ncbi:MAG: Rrf2 family transcriptional regulator [Planctomycetes bacterium]|nr:Rrf2 family transcriptional regulator [Planctomycetota bacterium]